MGAKLLTLELFNNSYFINLQKLDISSNPQITDNAFINLKNLSRLYARNCPQITDNCFIFIFMPNLVKIDVSFNYNIRLTGINFICMQKLKYIDIDENDHVSDDIISVLRRKNVEISVR